MCLHRAAFLNSITYLNSNVIPLITSIGVRTVSKFLKISRDPRPQGPYRRCKLQSYMAAHHLLNQEFSLHARVTHLYPTATQTG